LAQIAPFIGAIFMGIENPVLNQLINSQKTILEGSLWSNESELIVCLMSQRAPYENFLNAAKMTGEFVNILMN